MTEQQAAQFLMMFELLTQDIRRIADGVEEMNWRKAEYEESSAPCTPAPMLVN